MNPEDIGDQRGPGPHSVAFLPPVHRPWVHVDGDINLVSPGKWMHNDGVGLYPVHVGYPELEFRGVHSSRLIGLTVPLILNPRHVDGIGFGEHLARFAVSIL